MYDAFIGAAIGFGAYGLTYLSEQQVVWPDSQRYLELADGNAVPSPFGRRWLLPLTLRRRIQDWAIFQLLCATALGFLSATYVNDWRAAWFLMLLPGITWVHAKCPMLVDLPAMTFALAASVLWAKGYVALAMIAVGIAGAMKETAPVFGALYAGTPWLLVGLVCVNWRAKSSPTDDPWSGKSVLTLLRNVRQLRPFNWREREQLMSFGTLGVLFFLGAGWNTLTALALFSSGVALLQCMIAYDRVRLLHWSAISLLPVILHAPDPWLTLGMALHMIDNHPQEFI